MRVIGAITRYRWLGLAMVLSALLLAAALLLFWRSCSSSTEQAKEDTEKKDKKPPAKKPDFESSLPCTLPESPTQKGARLSGKPGHWSIASQQLRANHFNFSGQIDSIPYDRSGRPALLPETPYRITARRPVSLPKEQNKQVEFLYFMPDSNVGDADEPMRLLYRMDWAGSSRTVLNDTRPVRDLRSSQFYFVVLSANSDAFSFLEHQQTICPPNDQISNELWPHYLVARPKITDDTRSVPLSGNALCWTTIAYVLWDGIDPDRLTPLQQEALLDWLHWGGRLLVSGPESLDSLRGSFLAPYLPVGAGEPVKFTTEAFDELNATWSVFPQKKDLPNKRLDIPENLPMEGVTLNLQGGARFVPTTGGLVARRRVGRGEVSVTAFPLSERRVINWKNFDGFLNGCLMQRPGRTFTMDEMLRKVQWRQLNLQRDDPRLISAVRYYSRDIQPASRSRKSSDPAAPPPESNPPEGQKAVIDEFDSELPEREDAEPEKPRSEQKTEPDDWVYSPYRGFTSDLQSGVAGWNDFSGTSRGAREVLRRAAGVVVPKASFVVQSLLIYLVVLVPLNWLLFRLIGRVEWAWLAVPIIALGGTAVVIKLAQLDIGFARGRTEVALLEIQNDYPRGHLTTYLGFYTALSTSYQALSENETTQILPFSIAPEPNRLAQMSRETALFETGRGQVRLSGMRVLSNSTDMLHCEQMIPLGGSLRLVDAAPSPPEIQNGSRLDLHGVALLRRRDDKRLQAAWIGDLPAGGTAPVRWKSVTNFDEDLPEWQQSSVTRQTTGIGELNLSPLLAVASDPQQLGPGDIRLVGYQENPESTIQLKPDAAQRRSLMLVVAHLRLPETEEPSVDQNSPYDYNDWFEPVFIQ